MKKRLVIGIFTFLLFFSAAAWALPPSKCIINPRNQAVYVPYITGEADDTPSIKIYRANSSIDRFWDAPIAATISLPAGTFCYGLAVWQGESSGRLLVSVSSANPALQSLRYYQLDSRGLPVDVARFQNIDVSPALSSPFGVAIASDGNTAFFVDAMTGTCSALNTMPHPTHGDK